MAERCRSGAFALLIFLLPPAFFVSAYWPILSVDNGMTRLNGDSAALIQKTCLILAEANPVHLLLAHGDHLVAPVYVPAALLLWFFKLAYLPYALTLVAAFALAVSLTSWAVWRGTGSGVAASFIVILLMSGNWLAQGLVANFSEAVYALVVIFTMPAIVLFMRRSTVGPSTRNALGIGSLCTLAGLSVAPGVVAFGMLGLAWLFREFQLLIAARREDTVRSWRQVDWPLPACLLAGFLAVLCAYAYGQLVLDNAPIASYQFERAPAAMHPLLRVWTLFRVSWIELFFPNDTVEGSSADLVRAFGWQIRRGWPIAITAGLVCLLAAAHAMHVATRSIAAARIRLDGILILAGIFTALLVCGMTVAGRQAVPLNYSRYLFFPVMFSAFAFACAIGHFHRTLAGPVRQVAPVLLLLAAGVLAAGQMKHTLGTTDRLEVVRMYLQGRPPEPWVPACAGFIDGVR